MKPTKTLRFLLVTAGLIAVGIGAAILLAPARFHASYGIELGVTEPGSPPHTSIIDRVTV